MFGNWQTVQEKIFSQTDSNQFWRLFSGKGWPNKVLKVIYKVHVNAFLSWRILGELCAFPFCAHIISSCLNDVTSPSSSLRHKNGNKLDFPIFLHHCLNATKLGSLECVERCLKTVLMSDEVRNYPMKMIIHIKIWTKHQFLAWTRFYWSSWFHGQCWSISKRLNTNTLFRGHPMPRGMVKQNTVYFIYFCLHFPWWLCSFTFVTVTFTLQLWRIID